MSGVSRRTLLVGGGAGVGLVVSWALWPRTYAGNLSAAPGETIFGAWLKIGRDGHVTVAVPQCEHGQGVYTTLPQIVADELGADWRTVGVEAAPLNPLYANPLGAGEIFEGVFDALPDSVRATHAERAVLMVTGGSSSIRQFEPALRDAGAAARVLLCKVAATRWGVDWQACGTAAGFVVHGAQRLRFGELAEEAAGGAIPDPLPYRDGEKGRLAGQSVARLDAPAKVDGSAQFAADVRLPDMVFASICQGPVGDSRLVRTDKAAANRIRGVMEIVETERWVAAAAETWWAANQAISALAPRFETKGPRVDSASIDRALTAAFDRPAQRIASGDDLANLLTGGGVIEAEYRVGLGQHAAIEPMTATAYYHGDRLELWLPTQAPSFARSAAARAAGLPNSAVTVHPMLTGGGFGANLEHEAAAQAATLAVTLKRPVQLQWSRAEDLLHDRFRPPAIARMRARLAANGAILAWHARIAAPSTGAELASRLMPGDLVLKAALALPGAQDGYAVAGALPPYRLPAFAIDYHAADIGVPTGHLRGGAHGYTAFFTECFLDELARVAGNEAMSYRIGMLGGDARLARCLSTAASLGGWNGGVAGSGQGIACHAFRGSYVAVLAEAHVDEAQRIRVDRLVAAVDCGRQIHPDIVRQQIEGGLIFGLANALGVATGFTANLADVRGMGAVRLPRLAETPDILVEVIDSDADPGGVGEIGVPAVAPAIANALQSAGGTRLRSLPLRTGNQ
ncbi:xanthine dehydrogenase family protein molybdopterin-binding subunit [Sphingomonas sp. EC-HK361]|uniref:xanthine dehydrogenase family protein molybdopterin-binding subunit n=1 Tax=Sphingomonas sp. EC-HK361 TaxID=2038397 RepID=UPI00125FFD4E|nr:molybdopterin cofactor-binding domain-containing protein [Sphingomonas sp. EC-HK361]